MYYESTLHIIFCHVKDKRLEQWISRMKVKVPVSIPCTCLLYSQGGFHFMPPIPISLGLSHTFWESYVTLGFRIQFYFIAHSCPIHLKVSSLPKPSCIVRLFVISVSLIVCLAKLLRFLHSINLYMYFCIVCIGFNFLLMYALGELINRWCTCWAYRTMADIIFFVYQKRDILCRCKLVMWPFQASQRIYLNRSVSASHLRI